MDFIDVELKCLFCKAAFLLLLKDQACLRESGFMHDPRYCRDCKMLTSRSEQTSESVTKIDRSSIQ